MRYTGFISDAAMLSDARVEGRLYGFPINIASLGENHKDWLDDYVIPILEHGGIVDVVGEASRTGTPQQNQALSQRRASHTVEYVRSQCVGRAVIFTASNLLQSLQARGIGEQGAASIGQDDDTEDELFRAVTVIARINTSPRTRHPIPTPPSSSTRRVVFRRWRSVTSSSPSTGNPNRSGATGAALAGLIANAARGGTDERQYAFYPSNYAVTQVHERFVVTEQHHATGNSVVTERIIRYKWGPKTSVVELVTQIIDRPHGRPERVTPTRHTYLRNRIWRHVPSPSTTVF